MDRQKMHMYPIMRRLNGNKSSMNVEGSKKSITTTLNHYRRISIQYKPINW
uniref:Uncharacterized protein n=1 Tax=Ascaris lumbricoides TaxID=6252 RepID=A0A0M3HKX4_ASCLU